MSTTIQECAKCTSKVLPITNTYPRYHCQNCGYQGFVRSDHASAEIQILLKNVILPIRSNLVGAIGMATNLS